MAKQRISRSNTFIVEHNALRAQRELRRYKRFQNQTYYRNNWRDGSIEIRPDPDS